MSDSNRLNHPNRPDPPMQPSEAALISKILDIGSVLTLLSPLFLIAFFSTQMAIGRMQSKAEEIRAIPEYLRLARIRQLEEAQDVIVRGRLVACAGPENCAEREAELAGLKVPGPPDLLVYQVRPAEDRSARFREVFPLIFPALILELEDGGQLQIIPRSGKEEKLIYHEPRTVESEEFIFTGFQVGDELSVQGVWPGSGSSSPAPATMPDSDEGSTLSDLPQLQEVSGISGRSKAEQDREAMSALASVVKWRNWSGVLGLIGLIFGLARAWRRRRGPASPGNSSSRQSLPTS